MTENSDPIGRTLEVLLYAPLGIGLFLKETAPAFVDMFVARGRAEIDRRHDDVQQRVTTARSLGQVALAFGPPIVRERVGQTVAEARQRAEGLLGSPAPSPAPARPAPQNGSSPAPAPTTATGWGTPAPAPPESAPPAAPSAPAITFSASSGTFASDRPVVSNSDIESNDDLPIPGYDALSASQVVERLMGLSRAELDTVHAYESSQRQRRTILGKIEQLLG
jgi:hypothetical protein